MRALIGHTGFVGSCLDGPDFDARFNSSNSDKARGGQFDEVVCAGVLRGVADTLKPLLINVLGFWMVGMPISLHFGFRGGEGPVGLWWGLAAGLGAVASMLMFRVWIRFRRPLQRAEFRSASH